jgi:hypothetical protein
MNSDWLLPILKAVVFGVLMALVGFWLVRSRNRPRPDHEAKTLRHPPSTLVIGVVCSGFFGAIAILSNVYANPTTTIVTTSVFVGFALMGLPLIADYWFARHVLTSEGIHFGRMSGARRYLVWTDVSRVTYSASMKWFRIETRSGTVARFSVMLMGLPEFARAILENVDASAIDRESHEVLRSTAAGNPPSAMG